MTNDSLSLRDLVRELRYYKTRMATTFCTMFLAIFGVVMLLPNVYVSEAKILLRVGRSSVSIDPTVTVGQTLHMQESREREVLTELELLRSRELCEYVVQQLGVETILQANKPSVFDNLLSFASAPSDDATQDRLAVKLVSKSVFATATRNVNVIDLRCQASTPELAQKILTTFVDGYKKKHAIWNQASDSHDFFERQAEDAKKQLEIATNELRQAKDSLGVGSLEGEKTLINGELSNLERELVATRGSILAEESTIDSLKKSFPLLEKPAGVGGTTSPLAVDNMRNELYKLQILKADLTAKLSSNHPALKAVQEQVQEAEHLLARHEMLAAMGNIAAYQAKTAALQEKVRIAKAKQVEINGLEAKLHALNQNVTRLTDTYHKYASRLEESRISHALSDEQFTNIQVAQPPTFDPKHAWPKRLLILVAGVMCSFFVSCAVFVVTVMMRTPTTANELPRIPIRYVLTKP